jgi:hypothetical protein
MLPVGLLKGGDDEFGIVLASQWPARHRPTGPAALALLLQACRDAGLARAQQSASRSDATWQAMPP